MDQRYVQRILTILLSFIAVSQLMSMDAMEEKEGSLRAQAAARTIEILRSLSSGMHEQSIPNWDAGRPLRFTLSIPRRHDGEQEMPLVVSLHYGGRVKPFFGRDLLEAVVEPALRELGAVIIAPDSLTGDWTSAQDEEAVLFLIDSVMKSYRIDRARVLVTGYSLGGIGTWHFAGKHPELFSAAIPIAGKPDLSGEWRTPIYAIHSSQDRVIPLEPTRQRIEELRSKGINARLVVLEGIDHYATGEFRKPLKEAVPWLKEIWK